MAIDFSDLGDVVSQHTQKPLPPKFDFSDLGEVKPGVDNKPNIPSGPATEPRLFGPANSVVEAVDRFNPLSWPGKLLAKVPGVENAPRDIMNTPPGMFMAGSRAVSNLFNKAGEKVSEALAQKGFLPNPITAPLGQRGIPVSPENAARAGTVVSMFPDIVQSFAVPGEVAKPTPVEPLGFLSKTAQEEGVKALGYGKGMLKNPQAVARAKSTAQTMLDEGVISSLSSHEQMAAKATELGDLAGKKIGEYLQKVSDKGKFFDLDSAINSLEELRPKNGETGEVLTGGLYDRINSKIDNAVETIRAHVPGKSKPVTTEIMKGPSTQERVPDGFDVIQHEPTTERVPDGFDVIENPGKEGDYYTDALTGEKHYVEPNVEPSRTVVGRSKDVSLPGGSTVVGKSKYVDVPGKETVIQHGGYKGINWTGKTEPPKITFDEANKIKGLLQDVANFKSNKDATLLDRIIAGRFRQSVDDALEGVASNAKDEEAFQDFLHHKKLYSAAMQAQDPLYNRISSQLANQELSLGDLVLAAPEVAAGHSLTGLALVAFKKLLQRFGPQTASSLMNKAAKTSINPIDVVGSAMTVGSTALNKASGANNLLSEGEAKDYLRKANGDKSLARQLAARDGKKWQ